MADEEEGYGLVMPFVVCESKGGPYEDQAFVAGVRYGQIDAECQQLGLGQSKDWWAEPELVPQLDLLAMHHGLIMQAEPWDEHPDEWVHITMRRET